MAMDAHFGPLRAVVAYELSPAPAPATEDGGCKRLIPTEDTGVTSSIELLVVLALASLGEEWDWPGL